MIEILIVAFVLALFGFGVALLQLRQSKLLLDWTFDKVERYRQACNDIDTWCSTEIPQAKIVSAYIRACGEGQSRNAGTPAGWEVCNISGTRDQLRKLKMMVQTKRIDIDAIEIIPYPYTYTPAVACRNDGVVEWYDCRTGQELPPYCGYGADAQQRVDEWYRLKTLMSTKEIEKR